MAQNRLIAGRYELGDRLGTGGMATVYRAFDHVLSRPVAVKVLHDATHADQRARILREARAAAGLGHPNAVTVFDTGVEDDTPYLVLELVEGETLADRLATEGPLPPDEAVRIAGAVLGALEAAHVRGLIHRDVKPANVLLGRHGEVRLADFGIARDLIAGSTITATGQFLGTPAYVAPEQVAGQPATAATDLYGVGILLYEMLAGAPPFRHETALATALAHERELPPPLGERSAAGPALAAVVHQALEKDPRWRFESAGAMGAALHGALTGNGTATLPLGAATQPLGAAVPLGAAGAAAARQPGPAAGTWSALTRQPLLALIGGLLLVAAMGFAFASSGSDGGRRLTPTEPAGRVVGGQPTAPTVAPEQAPAPLVTQAPAEPQSLSELIAVLAEDPDRYGEKGRDLLDRLVKVAGADDDDRGEEARKTIEEAAKWSNEQLLDPTIAVQTVRILEPLAAEGDRGRGRDEGRGGDEDDEDDEDDDD